MNLIHTTAETIKRYNLLKRGDTVLIACSGGTDSVALLYILVDLKERLGLADIHVAHLDHCIRENSREDALFVRNICKKMHIPCIVGSFNVRAFAKRQALSIEDAARRVRYRFLEQTRKKLSLDWIATGHTLNDQIETLFLRIDRGTGLKGLSLIYPKRERVIRPLICTKKREILKFLRERSISYRIDETNLDLSIKRNLIRDKLLPPLLETLPNFGERLIHLRDILEQDEKIVESLIDKRWNEVVSSKKDEMFIDIKKIREQERPVKMRIIKRALETMSAPCDRKYVDYVLSFFAEGRVGSHIVLPNISVYRDYDRFIIKRRGKVSLSQPVISVSEEGRVELPDWTITTRLLKKGETPEIEWGCLAQDRVYFDLDRLSPPFLIRYRKRGDLFRPYGMKKKKRLKALFIDDKIPSYKRSGIPLFVDSNDEILWIVGHRRSDTALFGKETEKILEIKVTKAL